MNPGFDRLLEAALARHERTAHPPLPGRRNHIDAGILVPLLPGPALACVVTERASALSTHPGEVCFPGGRPEPSDPDLCATAMREAREEVGIAAVHVLGSLSSVPLYTSDHRLHPFVGYLDDPALPAVKSPDEVARVLTVSLAELLDAPHLHAIPWALDGEPRLSPVFEVGGRVMFGGTAEVLYELLSVVARVLERPTPRLRPGRYQWSDVLTISPP